MKVPGKPRRLEIDFVRGVAILLVMFAHFKKPHTGIWLLDAFNRFEELAGGHGVDLFFVLSGFLVGGLLLKEYRDTHEVLTGRFLIRRVFKIWPAYYFLIFFHLITRHHPPSTFFWQNFFHLQNYLGSSIQQTWTLSVEEHFYFLLAILLGFVATRKWSPANILKLLVGVSLIAFTARCITAYLGNTDGALRWTQNRMDSLLFGVIIALFFHFMPELYRKLTLRVWPLVVTSVIGVLWILFMGDGRLTRGPGYTVICVASGAFLILCMEHSGKLVNLRIYKFISTIGVYSYGLYLWHSAMLGTGEKVIARFPATQAWFIGLTAQFVGACLLAYATTRLVEWPALYWRESIPWLRDSKPLAKSPDEQGSDEESAGADQEGGTKPVLVGK
jgi:peptidoglycan/LPS O-acetylase OafA/YrhL